MNNEDRQDMRKIIKEVLEQKRIPDENKIRKIIKEEIESYCIKEERKKNEKISVKVNRYFKEGEYKKNMLYIPMFILIGMASFIYSIAKSAPNTIFQLILIIITAFVIGGIFYLYDKMTEKNMNHRREICVIELIICMDIFFPQMSEWLRNLLL